MIKAAYRVEWTEYERGWGQRPDGVSYYATKELADKCIREYDEKYNNEDEVPDCYTKAGSPKLVEVDQELYDRIVDAGIHGNGVWQ